MTVCPGRNKPVLSLYIQTQMLSFWSQNGQKATGFILLILCFPVKLFHKQAVKFGQMLFTQRFHLTPGLLV